MHLVVIPARYQSSRFPGKPLAMIGDKSMIRRVYDRCRVAPSVDRVIVATDDQRIADHVTQFNGEVMLTREDHVSGTDRVAEVAASLTLDPTSVVVNVQGDEPFIHPEQIEAVLLPFQQKGTQIATLARRITEEKELLSPNVVKVVRGRRGNGMYFSRHPIPYLRDVPVGRWIDAKRHLQHLGIYAYRADVLQQLTQLPAGELENDESLEQLRWLQAGYDIRVGLTEHASVGIDTPEDLARAVATPGVMTLKGPTSSGRFEVGQ